MGMLKRSHFFHSKFIIKTLVFSKWGGYICGLIIKIFSQYEEVCFLLAKVCTFAFIVHLFNTADNSTYFSDSEHS